MEKNKHTVTLPIADYNELIRKASQAETNPEIDNHQLALQELMKFTLENSELMKHVRIKKEPIQFVTASFQWLMRLRPEVYISYSKI